MANIDENKKYSVHKSKRFGGRIIALGVGFALGRLISRDVDYKEILLFFMIYVIVEFIILIYQYAAGRYAKVWFDEKGFKYRKYINSEHISWEDVYVVQEVNPFLAYINYYLVKTGQEGKGKEYLIEKSFETKPIIERLYYKNQGTDKKIYLPFKSNKELNAYALIISSILIGALFAWALYRNNWVSYEISMIIGAAVLLVCVLSYGLYKYFNRDLSYKVSLDGIKFRADKIEHFIAWDEVRSINWKSEHISAKRYKILTAKLANEIDGIYDTIEVPVSQRLAEKLGEKIKFKAD